MIQAEHAESWGHFREPLSRDAYVHQILSFPRNGAFLGLRKGSWPFHVGKARIANLVINGLLMELLYLGATNTHTHWLWAIDNINILALI